MSIRINCWFWGWLIVSISTHDMLYPKLMVHLLLNINLFTNYHKNLDLKFPFNIIFLQANMRGQVYILYLSFWYLQCQQFGKIWTGLTYKLLLSFTAISDVDMSFIKKHTFTSYCLSEFQSSRGALRSIVIWVRQSLVNFTGLAGIVNTTVYKTRPIFIALKHAIF